jgi:hypothetical protein
MAEVQGRVSASHGTDRGLLKIRGCRFATLAVQLLTQSRLDTPDHPYSLFEGIGGLAWLLSDVVKGEIGGFPAFSDVAV